jgi:hypothetical protein
MTDPAAEIRAANAVIDQAHRALLSAERTCRYHGTDWDRLGREPNGLPRCDSCKQPYRVVTALLAIENWQPPRPERRREAEATSAAPPEDARPIIELRDAGLLWLINAVTFHPRGYALALVVRDGAVAGWQLLGDGSEPWRYDQDMDARFAAAEATLANERGSRG